MKYFFLSLLLIISVEINATSFKSDEEKCLSYVKIKDNYKTSHENPHCIIAATAGIASAQYQVGMSYGYAGNSELEEKYYRLAANNRGIAAYLALGHVVRDENPWEAIYWYQRYVSTKSEGYGYAAVLIADLFEDMGKDAQSEYWRDVCRLSPYTDCDKKKQNSSNH